MNHTVREILTAFFDTTSGHADLSVDVFDSWTNDQQAPVAATICRITSAEHLAVS